MNICVELGRVLALGQQSMDETPRCRKLTVNHEKQSSFAFWTAVVFAALLVTPVLYVVAMGLGSFLFGCGQIDDATYLSIYAPYSAVEPQLPKIVRYVVDEFDTWCCDLGQNVAP